MCIPLAISIFKYAGWLFPSTINNSPYCDSPSYKANLQSDWLTLAIVEPLANCDASAPFFFIFWLEAVAAKLPSVVNDVLLEIDKTLNISLLILMSSPTENSVVKLVPLPVTVGEPADTETVPVLFW